MRILFDARVLGEQMHGIARYCLNLLQQLLAEERGHEYLVLISQAQVKEWFKPSAKVRWIINTTPMYSLQEQFLLPYQIRKEDFDCFHSPTYTIPLSLSAKGIMTIHDLIHLLFPKDYGLHHRLFYSLLVRPSIKRCPKVFTVSYQSKQDIIHLLKGQEQQIVVTPNGLDPHWAPRSLETGFVDRYGLNKGYVLYVGNPRPHKNFQRVLFAFEKLIQEDRYPGRLVAVGIAPSSLSNGLQGRVIFLPQSNDRELALFYSGADLLAAPSLYEGFGLPVLEAMACGCPVLIGNQGALPEIAGEAGIQVDPYDVNAIGAGIRDILADSALRQELRDRGLKRAALYTWEKTAQKVLETYRELEEK